MAITYEAAGQHEFSSATSALSFTPDSGTLTGDVFVVAVANRANATITPPAGTADQAFANLGPLGSDRRVSVFSWVAPSDAPGPVSVPLSASTTGSVTWTRFRGASGSFDADADNQAVGTNAVAPDLTVGEAGAFVLAGLFAESSSVSVSMGSGWTQRALTGVVRNFQATKGVQAAPGTSGSATITLGSSLGWVAWQVALAPAGTGPDPEVDVVYATSQTEYMPDGFTDDIADTPAIWVNTSAPERSVILGSRKAPTGGGIDVYGLDVPLAPRLSFLSVGEINNVALRDLAGHSGWGDRILVVGTNRSTNSLTYAWLDRATRTLSAAGSTAVGFEPYGTCLYVSPVDGKVYAFVSESTGGSGQLDQYELTLSGSTVTGAKVRDLSTATLSEGMACDDANGYLFLGEEDVGLFRYNAEPDGGTSRVTIDEVGGGHLFADVEGITIAYGREEGESGFLIVSSQGNSTFVVYDLASPHAYVKTFQVKGSGGEIDDVADTDGIAVTRADLGPLWPDGLFVVHDSTNAGSAASNFKLVNAGRIFGSYTRTPAPVAGTSTSALTTPVDRWSKGPSKVVWWDTSSLEWRAILPTSTGHRLYTLDPVGDVQGAVVDSRQGARVNVLHHAGTTYVLRAHSSGTLFSAFDSSWTLVVSDVAVPLAPLDNDASPTSLLRTSNGHLWAACHYGGQVRVTRSTDGGATWSSATTFALTGTGIPVLLEVGSTVVLFDTANAGNGRLVRTCPSGAVSIASGSWTTESPGSLPSGVTSDDHASGLVLPDGRALIVSKTTGATTTAHPLLYGLVREPSGVWNTHIIEAGPDTMPRYTRPRVTRIRGEVYVFYGSIEGPLDLTIRTMATDVVGTWSPRRAALIGPNWSDSAALPGPEDFIAASSADLWPLIAHDRDASSITVTWLPTNAAPSQIPGFIGTTAIEAMYVGTAPVEAIYLGDLQLV